MSTASEAPGQGRVDRGMPHDSDSKPLPCPLKARRLTPGHLDATRSQTRCGPFREKINQKYQHVGGVDFRVRVYVHEVLVGPHAHRDAIARGIELVAMKKE